MVSIAEIKSKTSIYKLIYHPNFRVSITKWQASLIKFVLFGLIIQLGRYFSLPGQILTVFV